MLLSTNSSIRRAKSVPFIRENVEGVSWEGGSREGREVPAGGILSLSLVAIAKICLKYFCFLVVVVGTQIYT